MTTKQDTPIKPHKKNNASSFHVGVKSKMPSNTSNEDLMNVLVSFKNEIFCIIFKEHKGIDVFEQSWFKWNCFTDNKKCKSVLSNKGYKE